MLDLIATRRSLHQIPELGMEEFETHAFLMETYFKTVLLPKSALGRQGFWSILQALLQRKRLAGGRILTACRLWRKRAWTSSPSTQTGCTPADMIST